MNKKERMKTYPPFKTTVIKIKYYFAEYPHILSQTRLRWISFIDNGLYSRTFLIVAPDALAPTQRNVCRLLVPGLFP